MDDRKVKCENYVVGCDWKGLFKQLMQHSQECQYVTVECRNPGCGQKVLLTKMEDHLKQECPQQHVNCKDCGKETYFIELQAHTGECPNASKACKNCKKKIPAFKLADHMTHECKYVRCVCKNDSKTYEAGSIKFHDHLQNVSKLADHLEPMICEFTKMSESFKEMSMAYQQATKRIDTLEKGHQEDVQRIKILEKSCQENSQRIEILEKRNNELEMTKQAGKKTEAECDDLKKRNDVLEKKVEELETQHSNLLTLNETLTQKVSSMAVVPKGPSFNEPSLQQLEERFSQRIGYLEKHWGSLRNEIQDICKNNSQLSDEIDNLKHQYTVSIPLSNSKKDHVQRIEMLEKICQEDDQRIKIVEKRNDELAIHLESITETYKNENDHLTQLYDKNCGMVNEAMDKMQHVQSDVQRFESSLSDMKRTSSKDHYEYLARLQDINIAADIQCGNKAVPHEKPSEFMKLLEDKVLEVERIQNFLSACYPELEFHLQASLASTHNGAFLWHIPEVRRRIRDAKMGRITSIYSPPFYTGRNGYKMCIRAFLNGDGSGKGTHLSIFFVLMKGEYDPLLQWPFEPKVRLILVDQVHKIDLVQTIKPNAQSSIFHRPKTDMNVASGFPEFAVLSILENPHYVKDDVMYIKAVVDTTKIFHP